jgi:cysteine synthase A
MARGAMIDSSLQMIGNILMVKLTRVTTSLDLNIFVKCEFVNPSGSIKDRMALKMIEGAEKKGRLRNGSTIEDMSSGNTGPALSFVGTAKGHRVRLHIPSEWTGTYSPENRIKLMKLFGAEVTPIELSHYNHLLKGLTEQQRAAAIFALGMKVCYDLEGSNPSFWWADQMSNKDNTLAHKEGTGSEIIDQLEGHVNAFVASIGTGGTLLGVAQALKEKNIDHMVFGVEPEDAKVLEEWAKSGFLSNFLEKKLSLPRRKYIIEEMAEAGIPDEMVHVSVRNRIAFFRMGGLSLSLPSSYTKFVI